MIPPIWLEGPVSWHYWIGAVVVLVPGIAAAVLAYRADAAYRREIRRREPE